MSTQPAGKSTNDATQIMRERARAMARPIEEVVETGAQLVIVEFRLAKERYAIEQKHVREVSRVSELTTLPGTPGFVVGIINVRGQLLCVIDMKKFFDLPDEGITDLHAVIIVKVGQIELGILADIVVGVRSIPASSLQGALATLTGIRAEYLKGVSDEHVAVLDVERIVKDPKITVNG
jgi:purine-binding chemotaxis protein CheW